MANNGVSDAGLPVACVLDDLLKAINVKNLHEAVEFGAPAGKEVW